MVVDKGGSIMTTNNNNATITHKQWVNWAHRRFSSLGYVFTGGRGMASDMCQVGSGNHLPKAYKWRTVKQTGVLPV